MSAIPIYAHLAGARHKANGKSATKSVRRTFRGSVPQVTRTHVDHLFCCTIRFRILTPTTSSAHPPSELCTDFCAVQSTIIPNFCISQKCSP
ncbi:hypothetical protein BRADO6365 [Bradyrhizobium sp. ORS 278]|nr:hypothetical protein BRADO6365 [Bradyrhizobium sp. ORS 278]